MNIRNLRILLVLAASAIALCCAGCNHGSVASGASPIEPGGSPSPEAFEAQQVAESVLGKDAQVLAYGDLAKNGKAQVLAITPLRRNVAAQHGTVHAIAQAAIMQKDGERWTEVLLCDENLKNPQGYLGGTSFDPVPGWDLEVRTSAQQTTELGFTPANRYQAADGTFGNDEVKPVTFLVRWNPKAKLYQTFDPSKERFLSESSNQRLLPSILR